MQYVCVPDDLRMENRVVNVCAVLFIPAFLGLAVSAAEPAEPAATLPATGLGASADRRRALAEEIERYLTTKHLDVWFPRAVDREAGGFWPDFDFAWKRTGPNQKGIVVQARQTWLAAQAARRYPDKPVYREAARHGLDYLCGKAWDGEQGGWHWMVDADGRPVAPYGTTKQAYGMAFGIYACAAAFETLRDEQALKRAREAFEWFDRKAHDAMHGGYHVFLRRDGSPILRPEDVPSDCTSRTGATGTPPGYKDMNTHIHLLEAFTALHTVWPDARLRERLEELLRIISRKVAVQPGALHLYFNADWTPVPDHNSYGHDVETAYLILEALAALKKEDPEARAMARMLVDHAMDVAWDAREGGLYYTGTTFGRIFEPKKDWWTQAEAMNAFLLMAVEHPGASRDYAGYFEREWTFIRNRMVDAEHGGWFMAAPTTDEERRAPKGSNWKAGYHDGRAMMNVIDLLRDDARWPRPLGPPR